MTEIAGPWGEVPPQPDNGGILNAIRAARSRDPRTTVVLDDDPTGSQSVHGVEVVMALETSEYASALPSDGFFVLTNSRSLVEPEARRLTAQVADDLFQVAGELELVSRSDSTMRGHLMAETAALDDAHRRAGHGGHHATLVAPAFIEAGRVTANDTHWARVGGVFVPVGDTEFAKDAVFGYRSSNLRALIEERSGGRIAAADVRSIGLDDIRRGGPERVARLVLDAPESSFHVVNALDYADLEIVALGALMVRERGADVLYRTGPSFVRAMLGQEASPQLTTNEIWPGARVNGHGLVVVGSHVAQTGRQLEALRRRGGVEPIEFDVAALLGGEPKLVDETADRVMQSLEAGDVLLYTSRVVMTAGTFDENLRISRRVSRAVAAVVAQSLDASPAWVLAKGGITSHDVALHGLGIRRATVVGQFFPGLVSLFRSVAADPRALGRPYVVFAGNVGDDEALADIVDRLRGVEQR
jgi:uncharacterized protein YgbK (DUF1537 family)